MQYRAGATPIGEQSDITLSPRDDCQLLLIARGEGNTAPGINDNLASPRNLSMPQNVFDAIPATGATAGDFPGENASVAEFVRRCGVLYQWGRKDPTFASVDGTSSEKNILFDGFANPISIQRASYNASMLTDGNTILYTIRYPLAFIIGTEVWYNGSYSAGYRELWNNNGAKTIYDPCPDGWKVPDKSIWSNLSVNNSYWFDSNSTFVRTGSHHTRGGRRYNLNGANGVPAAPTPYNTAWFPTTGYREHTNGNIGIPTAGYLFGNTIDTSNNKYYYLRINNGGLDLLSNAGIPAESEATRCVQE